MIYFVENMVTGNVKIGIALDPARRLQSLTLDSPLRLVMELDGDQHTEGLLHCALRRFHCQGEWFQGGPHFWSAVHDLRRHPRLLVALPAGGRLVYTKGGKGLPPGNSFEHRGRKYRLIKHARSWYIHYQNGRGERCAQCCHTNHKEEALNNAKIIIDAATLDSAGHIRRTARALRTQTTTDTPPATNPQNLPVK
jgi:hypothetical protein